MLDKHQIQRILQRNPQIDTTALKRSREAAERLAEAGIELTAYRLQPALGGAIIQNEQAESRVRHERTDR